MKKINKKLKISLFFIVAILLSPIVVAADELSYGYNDPSGRAYTNWASDPIPGRTDAKTKTFYRSRNVTKWSSNLVQSSRFPSFYTTGTYSCNPHDCNCYDCNPWTETWNCNFVTHCNRCRTGWHEEWVSSSGPAPGDCKYTYNYPPYMCHVVTPVYEYNCSKCGSYTTHSTCSETYWNRCCDTCWDTCTGYYPPEEWSSWTAWQEASITQTTSRQVEAITFYSYPIYSLDYHPTAWNNYNGYNENNPANATTTPNEAYNELISDVDLNGNPNVSGLSSTQQAEFYGWYCSAQSTSPEKQYAENIMGDSDVTVYAHWAKE